MSKSDKELTVEVVNTFVQSWNDKNNTSALSVENVTDLIKAVHSTVKNLNVSDKPE